MDAKLLSLSLWEEHRLRVYEKSVEKNIWTKSEKEVSWRKLHYDNIHSLYSSPNIVRVIK